MKKIAMKTKAGCFFFTIILISSAIFFQPVFAANTVIATLPIGPEPIDIAISPDGAYAWVPEFYTQKISIINLANNVVTSTISLPGIPYGIAFTPNGQYAYVSNLGGQSVWVINTASRFITATIPVGTQPEGIAITPNGALAYVANSVDNTVSVINTTTNTVISTVTVGNWPGGIAVTPDGANVYTANLNGATISVINTATNTATNYYVSGYPNDVVVTPDGAYAYVTNSNGNNVFVVNTATKSVTATISVGGGPRGLAITPDGAYVYVANRGSNTVSVIKTSTRTVTATVTVGIEPYDAAVTPNGAYVYVINYNYASSSISVLNTAALSVIVSAPSTKINLGQSEDFTATPNGGTGTYTSYRWYVNGTAQSGQTGPMFTFHPSSTGIYAITATVKDSSNAMSPQSFAASMEVGPAPSPTPNQGGSSSSTTTQAQTSTSTQTPTTTPSPTIVSATTDSGKTIDLPFCGNMTSSQMADVKISANESAASTTVSLTVTGQGGDTGFCNMTIPKTAVPYGTTPTIFIDDQPVANQGYTQDTDNYYVWYTTHFSTHQVSIVFSTSASSPTPSSGPSQGLGWMQLAVVGAIAAIVASALTVAVAFRRKKG